MTDMNRIIGGHGSGRPADRRPRRRMPLKVFAWTTMRGGKQLRAICAETSLAKASVLSEAAVLGKIGRDYYSLTGNEEDLRVALDRPCVVFVRPLDEWAGKYVEA